MMVTATAERNTNFARLNGTPPTSLFQPAIRISGLRASHPTLYFLVVLKSRACGDECVEPTPIRDSGDALSTVHRRDVQFDPSSRLNSATRRERPALPALRVARVDLRPAGVGR